MDPDLVVIVVAFIFGLLVGLALALVLRVIQAKTAREIAGELFRDSEQRYKQAETALLEAAKNNFSRLSMEVLEKSNNNFLTLAQEKFGAQTERHVTELDSKKQLIDQQIAEVEKRLREVSGLVHSADQNRQQQYGALEQQLATLSVTANELGATLKNNRERGQWGERMALDILELAGFIEGINFTQQATIQGTGKRPDFTFMLPNGLVLNMDCKFPLDNYSRCVNAGNDADRQTYRTAFFRDVRTQIKQVVGREYINVEQSTVDCALMFIPNEGLMRFIHEEDPTLVNEALKSKVILCSPLTLFVVLAVIRQAAQNFALQQSSRDVLKLLDEFKKHWSTYVNDMTAMGKEISKLEDTYKRLINTRQAKLEKPLEKVDELLSQYDLSDAQLEVVEQLP